MAEGRQGSTSPFPCLLEQGCQRGVRLLRQREAEQAPHPSWGGSVGHRRNRGGRGKASPPALAEGEGVQRCHRRERKQEKKKRETEDDGGWRSPAIHPLAFWALDRVAALASTWVPCFEVLLARDGATTGLGTGRARGWAGIFPVECLRIRCFHAAWSPTSQYMSVCVCCGRGGGVCILGVLWLLNAVSSFQHSPLPQVPLCDFGDGCPCTRGGVVCV